MRRKECVTTIRVRFAARMAILAALTAGSAPRLAVAGTIRVWPTAVVMDDAVRLVEIAEARDFDAAVQESLSTLEVGTSPEAGGSKYISIDSVRRALRDAGFNLADMRVQGASQCAISRPAEDPGRAAKKSVGAASGSARDGDKEAGSDGATLRDAVTAFITGELQRYGGQPEVTFDRTAEQVLDLRGPDYSFAVRRRGGGLLGITSVEVDVVSGGKIVQTVPLVVQVRMNRAVLTARRAINQDARIRSEDVNVTTVTLNRLDQSGLDDAAAVIGQRAKRFIPVGMQISADMLDSVPLVRRGELVILEATVGGISVVTSAKADADGRLHEVIRVRSLEKRREEFDAVVIGAGKVRLGGPVESGEALALGAPK